MEFIIIFIAALLPAVLLGIYIWKQDSQKEPASWLRKAILYGVIICVPAVVIEMGMMSLLFESEAGPQSIIGTTAEAFFCAAIPEECLKLWALRRILRRNPYFDEHFDGIVYAVCIGLGFAGVENLGYLIDNSEEWFSVALARSLMAVPAHYGFAVIMGYYYSKYHFVDRSLKTKLNIIAIPVLLHGLYDSLLMTSEIDLTIGGICSIVAIYLVIRIQISARKKIVEQIERDRNTM